jgi:hypothetical protein
MSMNHWSMPSLELAPLGSLCLLSLKLGFESLDCCGPAAASASECMAFITRSQTGKPAHKEIELILASEGQGEYHCALLQLVHAAA